jgi:hypothetical protein
MRARATIALMALAGQIVTFFQAKNENPRRYGTAMGMLQCSILV